jgi:hypothetical protein
MYGILQFRTVIGLTVIVLQLREEQTELERRLWEERQAILKKHEDKVQIARNK